MYNLNNVIINNQRRDDHRILPKIYNHIVTKFVMEGRKRTGLAWEDSGEIYSDKLKQLRTLRALKTSTLSVVSAITLSIRFGCLPLTDRAPESSLRLSLRVPTPRWLYWVSPRQLLQSDTGVPHFALDPLTYRCLLSLSPAADFAEPRPPRHTYLSFKCINVQKGQFTSIDKIWQYRTNDQYPHYLNGKQSLNHLQT